MQTRRKMETFLFSKFKEGFKNQFRNYIKFRLKSDYKDGLIHVIILEKIVFIDEINIYKCI